MNASLAPGVPEAQHATSAYGASASDAAKLERMLGAGLALIPIPHGSKGPTIVGWNTPGACIRDPRRAGELVGQNAGLAHAYSGTGALDIDNFPVAAEFLATKSIDLAQLCMDERAVQVRSGAANRAKLLYRLETPLRTVSVSPGGLMLSRCAARRRTG